MCQPLRFSRFTMAMISTEHQEAALAVLNKAVSGGEISKPEIVAKDALFGRYLTRFAIGGCDKLRDKAN